MPSSSALDTNPAQPKLITRSRLLLNWLPMRARVWYSFGPAYKAIWRSKVWCGASVSAG